MDKLNLTNYAAKFSYNNQLHIKQSIQPAVQQSFSQPQPVTQQTQPPLAAHTKNSGTPQLGNLAGTETSVYVKDLMNLPKNLNEFVYMVQRGINQAQLNRFLAEQYSMRAANNMTSERAQILAQLQGMSTEELQTTLKTQMAALTNNNSLKDLEILQNGMIKMSALSELLQAGGKDAIAKVIMTMANASQQGIKDLSQLKDTAKLINASVAIASQDNSAQTLKALMLLYLPWLPLQEGTDFEIEIKGNPESSDEESILVITIKTVNFGKVIATVILETSNSVHVNIECSDSFPKEELMSRIRNEETHYSMQSVLSFQKLEAKSEDVSVTRAKVTMSSMDEVNPYMLLTSHAIIRNTIIIDNEASNGVTTHIDEN